MTTEAAIRSTIRQFVLDNLLLGDAIAMVKDSDSFMETGTIDSTGMLEVVTFLEHTFALEIDDRELIPDNLDSVDKLVQFIGRKQNAA